MKKYIRPNTESVVPDLRLRLLSDSPDGAPSTTTSVVGKSQLSKDGFGWDEDEGDN